MPKAKSSTTKATSAKSQLLGPSQRPRKIREYRSEEQRRQDLCDDPWTVTDSVKPYEVRCSGCNKIIALERTAGKSGPYYDTLWKKHRDFWCHGVKKWKEEQKEIALESADTSEPESDTTVSEISGEIEVNVPVFYTRVDMVGFLAQLDTNNPAAFWSLSVDVIKNCAVEGSVSSTYLINEYDIDIATVIQCAEIPQKTRNKNTDNWSSRMKTSEVWREWLLFAREENLREAVIFRLFGGLGGWSGARRFGSVSYPRVLQEISDNVTRFLTTTTSGIIFPGP